MGKKANLPKLKNILANPYSKKCPLLEESELKFLKDALKTAIGSSGKAPQAFANEINLNIGLQSSLRAMNNANASFVMLSLSIKPHHLISLLARNAQVKDETVPVYAQPKLEVFVEELFGIRAIALVFPKDLSGFATELQDWIMARQRPAKVKVVPLLATKAISQKKQKRPRDNSNLRLNKNVKKLKKSVSKSSPKKESIKSFDASDFISFSNESKNYEQMDKLKLSTEKQLLEGVLNNIKRKAEEIQKSEPKGEHLEDKSAKPQASDDTKKQDIQKQFQSSDSEDFLQEYKPTIVHKINVNPNKKPKKKRKNKNKK